MIAEQWLRDALEPALRLLPAKMDSQPARALVIAACLQESSLSHRFQVGGPAVSYAMFELGGIRGVMRHMASAPHVIQLLQALDYPHDSTPEYVYAAMPHNDIMSAGMARLLIWTLPQALPAQNAPMAGLSQYLAAWRPGTPRPGAWPGCWMEAWQLVA